MMMVPNHKSVIAQLNTTVITKIDFPQLTSSSKIVFIQHSPSYIFLVLYIIMERITCWDRLTKDLPCNHGSINVGSPAKNDMSFQQNHPKEYNVRHICKCYVMFVCPGENPLWGLKLLVLKTFDRLSFVGSSLSVGMPSESHQLLVL